MSARIPTQHKTPFEIDPRPLDGIAARQAGFRRSRAYPSFRIRDLGAANLKLKKRQRGCSDAQYIESVVLLQTAGGDCPEDMSLLADDACLERGLGFALPKTSAVRGFLNRFHDEKLALARPARDAPEEFYNSLQ